MARASLRYTPITFSTPEHYCLAVIHSRTSLSLSLDTVLPLMERGFCDCTAREKGSCMQGTSQAVGCEQHQCGTGGRMEDVECKHASQGGSCLGWAVSKEGCVRGQNKISPKPKLKNTLSHPAGLRELLGATCCLDAELSPALFTVTLGCSLCSSTFDDWLTSVNHCVLVCSCALTSPLGSHLHLLCVKGPLHFAETHRGFVVWAEVQKEPTKPVQSSATLVLFPLLRAQCLLFSFHQQVLTGQILHVWQWSDVLDVHVFGCWDAQGTVSSSLRFCRNVAFLKWSMLFACQMAWGIFTALLAATGLAYCRLKSCQGQAFRKKKKKSFSGNCQSLVPG